MIQTTDRQNFSDQAWEIFYLTSSLSDDEKPADILQDFYFPVLSKAIRYDRVCGYFNPTSLAAASQGLSAFAGNNGRARFIVGADIPPAEAQRVIDSAGTEAHDRILAGLLAERLEAFDDLNESVRNGLHLIAWMAARGLLEIRAAVRVHARTGRADAFDARDDGFICRRWAMFRDGNGNRIHISGALNESRASLSVNAESIDVHCDWKNEENFKRAEKAERNFDLLWDDENRYLRVFALPRSILDRFEAIANLKTGLTEIDGASGAADEVTLPSAMERLKFALIKDGPKLPGGQFTGMETAPVIPWPHQENAAKRLITAWPSSFLLCDDVGLGKTIEAGLVVRSLYLSGLAERVLIVSPPDETAQWQVELADKFFLPFARARDGAPLWHEYLLPIEEQVGYDSIFTPDLNVISYSLLSRPECNSQLLNTCHFDLVILDQIHGVAQANDAPDDADDADGPGLFFTAMKGIRPMSRGLYMNTAAPALTPSSRMHKFAGLTRRIGAFQHDFGLVQWYGEIMSRLNRQETIAAGEWNFLRKSMMEIEVHDPMFFNLIIQAVIDQGCEDNFKAWLNSDGIPEPEDQKKLLGIIFLASPLWRVMLRHTRPQIRVSHEKGYIHAAMAKRVTSPIVQAAFSPLEEMCNAQLENYCATLSAQIGAGASDAARIALRGYLNYLRRRLGSSLHAIRETFRRRLEKIGKPAIEKSRCDADVDPKFDVAVLEKLQEDDHPALISLFTGRNEKDIEWEKHFLTGMLEDLFDLSGASSKMTELLAILEKKRQNPDTGRIRQTVIVTQFYDTLVDIVHRLRQADSHMLIGAFSKKGSRYMDPRSGQMAGVEADQLIQRFLNQDVDALVCTDEVAYQVNMETADMMINFDLPWDPLKLERRICLMDRVGQQNELVEIINLAYAGSTEDIVYGRLVSRLCDDECAAGVRNGVFTEFPVSKTEFAEIAEKKIGEAELERRVRERLNLIRKRSESLDIPPSRLADISNAAVRMMKNHRAPINLDVIWDALSGSTYFHQLGCRIFHDADKKTMILRNIPGFMDGALITASRETYKYGIKELPGKLHFASYGDPVFYVLLSYIDDFGLPECIKKIKIEKSDVTIPMAAYAAACLDENGETRKILITSPDQLAGLELDETAVLTDEDILPLRAELLQHSEREFQRIYAAERIERRNQDAGMAQLAADYALMIAFIKYRQEMEMSCDDFLDEVKEIEAYCRETAFLTLPGLSGPEAAHLQGAFFGQDTPDADADGSIVVPTRMLLVALDAACHLARTIQKNNNAELLTDEVVARLETEAEDIRNVARREQASQ